MKLKQFIKEASDNIADVNLIKKYFDIEGTITPSDRGLVIEGSMDIKDRVYLDELPVKIHSVSGNFNIAACKLKSLKNFPATANKIDVSGNAELTSLTTDEPITCQTFSANEVGITSLDNVKINARTMFLRECENLQSVLGNSGQIKRIDISGCPQLQQDPTLIPGIELVRINPYTAKNVPLVRIILDTSVDVKFEEDTVDKNLEKIITKYRHQGPSKVLDLIRELRDAGYKGNARV